MDFHYVYGHNLLRKCHVCGLTWPERRFNYVWKSSSYFIVLDISGHLKYFVTLSTVNVTSV